MSETENIPETEKQLAATTGLMLVKPDAVKLGIAEELIGIVTEKVVESKSGKLSGVYIVQLNAENTAGMYPNLPAEIRKVVENYLAEDVSILVIFRGNGRVHLGEYLRQIRGKKLMDWTEEEMAKGIGMEQGVRGIIPVPGTREDYEPVLKKIREKKLNPDVKFSEEEMAIHSRNLVHMPDGLSEMCGLLTLINEEQLRENFSPEEIEAWHKLFKSIPKT